MSEPNTQAQPRSVGHKHIARALWYTAPGHIELRPETLQAPGPGEALVRTHYSALSRGTERLVFRGEVPESEWDRMRAPHQSGSFPFPVKYGYSAAGHVEHGPRDISGRNVFCLYPHQDFFLADPTWLVPLPDTLPLRRATLTANMETALNAIWDAGASPCDHIVVIGAGIVGLLTAFIASRIAGTTVTIVDPLAEREQIADALGYAFALPENTPRDADIVFHTSANPKGLETAFESAGFEATIVEMSWYGSRIAEIPLGGAFHSRRLRLVSSQVGHVAPSHRSRWSHRRRVEAAIGLLAAPELDHLVENEIAFSDAMTKLPAVFEPEWAGLPPVISYT
jgi:threonine dehydrogenase-like Zn-dependent dehydrogenase